MATGLTADESQSLLDVWKPGLFDRSGLTLFYRIPQTTYDQWIPLHLKPAPVETVRTGLVVHYHLEPELDRVITRLVSELGSDHYRIRDNAERRLHGIGGAALPAIRKIAESADVETAARARQLINSLDVDELLEQVMTRYQKSGDK